MKQLNTTALAGVQGGSHDISACVDDVTAAALLGTLPGMIVGARFGGWGLLAGVVGGAGVFGYLEWELSPNCQ